MAARRNSAALMDPAEIAITAGQLRGVVGAIERCELEATTQQAAYLSGAADALEALTEG
ncbi:hypothetical protein [Mycolicibacterium tokaiense]|nr:hypothetical protein [Mycolicibacterium tokaiense]